MKAPKSRLRVGLNGFGRIGRCFSRIALDQNLFDLVVINTRHGTPDELAYQLQYDSVYRTYAQSVVRNDQGLTVAGQEILTTNHDQPAAIPWAEAGVDVVVDATGAFTTTDALAPHFDDSVKRVILSAPAKDEVTPTIVLGVNSTEESWLDAPIVSAASCTTNCAAPMMKVLHETFGVESASLTTAHAYTMTQSLLDDGGSNIERSRSASLNIIPTSTGAATAVAKTIPELAGKIDGIALRVPIPTVSFTDITAVVNKPVSIEAINQAFNEAATNDLVGILDYQVANLVSSDYIGSPFSCSFDANHTNVIGRNLVKIYGWYDNEWGYANRLVDMVNCYSAVL